MDALRPVGGVNFNSDSQSNCFFCSSCELLFLLWRLLLHLLLLLRLLSLLLLLQPSLLPTPAAHPPPPASCCFCCACSLLPTASCCPFTLYCCFSPCSFYSFSCCSLGMSAALQRLACAVPYASPAGWLASARGCNFNFCPVQ